MKKLLMTILTLTLCAITAFCLTACNSDSKCENNDCAGGGIISL